jgi:hypothetical protein
MAQNQELSNGLLWLFLLRFTIETNEMNDCPQDSMALLEIR